MMVWPRGLPLLIPVVSNPSFFLLTSIQTTTSKYISCLRCCYPSYSRNLFPQLILLLAFLLTSQPLSVILMAYWPCDSTFPSPCLIIQIVLPFNLFTSYFPFSSSSYHMISLFVSHKALLVNVFKNHNGNL